MQQDLYQQMRVALSNYNTKMQQYHEYLTHDENSGSPQAQLLAQELEVCRHNYYEARIKYEKLFGDVERYQQKIQRFHKWSREVGIKCVTGKAYDKYEIKSVLGKAITS